MKTEIQHKWRTLFILLITFILLYFLLHFVLYDDIINQWNNYNLHKDGVCILKNLLSKEEIKKLIEECKEDKYKEVKNYLINNRKIKKIINNRIGQNYHFQDYIFIIKKSAIHTCHRDSNGDFFNEGQQYPSYTMLVFLEDMEKCLGVIPKSHKEVNSFNINFTDPVVNLICKKGDAILFNANLIHVGALNNRDDNLRIQLKITHDDDIDAIPYYNNYNKILNEDNNLPFLIRKAQKKISCILPILSNYSQNEIQRTARGSDNGIELGFFQKLCSYLFYGNVNFYDLPNAF